MKKLFILILLIISKVSFGQTVYDTLHYHRGVSIHQAFINHHYIPNERLERRFKNAEAYESIRLLKSSKVMMPTGIVMSLAGVGIATHALIGTRHTYEQNNITYTYYKRPIFQVISGIAVLAGGITVLELGKDKKSKAIDLYNEKVKNTQLGFLDTGNFGLKLNLK